MSHRDVIIVVGLTASGKTKLAVALARRFNGEIISADSRQVYKGMDLGTGKDLGHYIVKIQKSKMTASVIPSPTRPALAVIEGSHRKSKVKSLSVPYHLIDVVSPKTQFTVAEFQKLAYRAIADILRRGKLPILCGGTGLYVDAVARGYRFGESRIKNQESRKLRQRLELLTTRQLLERLKKIDPATYRVIDRNNRRRVQRALEIYYATGKPKSRQLKKNPPPYQFLWLGVAVPKAVLHRRIARRLRQRLRQGMIAEVRWLHRQGVSWKRLDAFGLEYRWVSRFLRGMIDRQTMERRLLADIKQYARRQMTWFRRNPEIQWVNGIRQAIALSKKFISKN